MLWIRQTVHYQQFVIRNDIRFSKLNKDLMLGITIYQE